MEKRSHRTRECTEITRQCIWPSQRRNSAVGGGNQVKILVCSRLKLKNVQLRNNYSFLFCLLDICGQSIIRGSENLFIEQVSNGRGSLDYAKNVVKNFDEPKPDYPLSNSKHISSRRFLFEFPSRGLETEFPRRRRNSANSLFVLFLCPARSFLLFHTE